MSRGPLPSRLCLLSSLPEQRKGDKVRFLGCVTSYDVNLANLELDHPHPKGSDVTATVDCKLVLATIGSEQTRVGEWVNVLGYVTSTTVRSSKDSVVRGSACVQALLVWSTGPLDVQKYEGQFVEE